MLADKDTNHNSTVVLAESTDIVDQVSKEIVLLNQTVNSKVSDDMNNEPSESAALISKKTILVTDVWPHSFTTSVPLSPEQCSMTRRRLFPSAATVPVTIVRDPSFYLSFMLPVLSEPTSDAMTIITPIIFTYEILGPDKGKISAPATSKNTSKACMKSEKILSKFWADDLDTNQASDNTLELDTNAEGLQVLLFESSVAAQYLLQNSGTTKKGKRGRPRMTKNRKDNSGNKAQGFLQSAES
ncbi:hypothetical protein MtrunA17_Chr3g0108131 [Medicago truncatula]|nr:hypothetical protein MtrunA17_Chr3g0108131 [Medicago truncatula]